MPYTTTYDQVLDAVDHLPVEQQADLIEVVRRRLAARGREQVLADVREGLAEHARGESRRATAGEIMGELGR